MPRESSVALVCEKHRRYHWSVKRNTASIRSNSNRTQTYSGIKHRCNWSITFRPMNQVTVTDDDYLDRVHFLPGSFHWNIRFSDWLCRGVRIAPLSMACGWCFFVRISRFAARTTLPPRGSCWLLQPVSCNGQVPRKVCSTNHSDKLCLITSSAHCCWKRRLGRLDGLRPNRLSYG